MAYQTNINLRKIQIYSVFTRNHTQEGTLKSLEGDLERIKNLGTDYIWLLPINPSGVVDRKGQVGSPYAISDYRTIDKSQGTWEDFEHLVKAIHAHGMKAMIDIVYNHTSCDSVLLKKHPEWFLHDDDGNLHNKNPEWTDVAELDYSEQGLWDYQIETLKMYAKVVDGFRCDVAPQVPIHFWEKARQEVSEVNDNILWLAESTGGDYIKAIRNKGYWISSDSEIYRAFDFAYDYDIDQIYRSYAKGQIPLSRYVEALNQQELIYPANYIKMRGLENHDQVRAHHLFPNENDLINWTAFSAFQKGSTLIYAGQEVGMKHTPDLFNVDKLNWKTDMDLSSLIKRLHELSQDEIQYKGSYDIEALDDDVVKVTFKLGCKTRIGIFTLKGKASHVKMDLPDAKYTNLITENSVEIHHGLLSIDYDPIIIEH
ncbi:alpha-amylase family glycosyl hydrolase [Companilactobacillus nodensis]|uniref:Alpha amylase catalytic region n=1 Tax=Companilactobacillus nodensis DSM 19682 = JCM 14932 = NBRC 107160 TaxID=1423775 RepID=A0A0R1K9R1_9LACO|nr:alpha-amylase family glycosyl hydrolase [Companilactobacillus nodensis]KRK80430.1 alpha amylase catalytic region [Companilactobacillus nodensis DSM 19682 = JCM 14932 = NBRC 107160]